MNRKTLLGLCAALCAGTAGTLAGCGDDAGGGGEGEAEAEGDAATDGQVAEQPTFADLSAAVQVDRVGKPAINTTSLPAADCTPSVSSDESCKTTYNKNESPSMDLTLFGTAEAAVGQLSGPDSAPATTSLWQGALLTDAEAVTIAGAVWGDGGGTLFFGDMLVIDTSQSNGYTLVAGGRAPTDDVIDTTLDAITLNSAAAGNSAGVASDAVDANDVAFPTAFPYFAAPNP